MERKQLKLHAESLLFVAGRPLSAKRIASLLQVSEGEAQGICQELGEELKERGGGVRIIKNGQRYQMVSAGEAASSVQKLLEAETSGELTQPSLETLTIIAYRGPVSKIEIERIRGVNCSLILRNLLMRGLVEYKNDQRKKETYYTVSFEFLKYLGVEKVEELPDYERLSRHESIEEMMEDRDKR